MKLNHNKQKFQAIKEGLYSGKHYEHIGNKQMGIEGAKIVHGWS